MLRAWCGELEMRLVGAGTAAAYFKFRNHTRNMDVQVTLLTPKFVPSKPKHEKNVRFG